MDKDVMTKPEQSTGEDTDNHLMSVNIDSFPDSTPQTINLQNVVEESSASDIPIDLDQLIIDENGYVQKMKRELRVSVDLKTGDTIVAVIDGLSRNIVRQIPQNEILAVERLITAPAGMLFRAHA